MKWYVNTEIDYGMENKPDYDSVYTHEGFKLVLEAAFQACRMPGNEAIVKIRASNLVGMDLGLSNMHWSAEALRHFHEAEHLATEMYTRETYR